MFDKIKEYVIVAISVSVILAVACTNGEKKYKTQLQQIDSLASTLNSLEKSLLVIDTASIKKEIIDVNTDIAYIQDYFHDTLNQKDALMINDYRLLNNTVSQYFDNYGNYLNEIKIARKQLSDLTHDLKHDLLEDKQVVDFMKEEIDITEKLILNLNERTQDVLGILTTQKNTKPQIKAFIENMKNAKEKEEK